MCTVDGVHQGCCDDACSSPSMLQMSEAFSMSTEYLVDKHNGTQVNIMIHYYFNIRPQTKLHFSHRYSIPREQLKQMSLGVGIKREYGLISGWQGVSAGHKHEPWLAPSGSSISFHCSVNVMTYVGNRYRHARGLDENVCLFHQTNPNAASSWEVVHYPLLKTKSGGVFGDTVFTNVAKPSFLSCLPNDWTLTMDVLAWFRTINSSCMLCSIEVGCPQKRIKMWIKKIYEKIPYMEFLINKM